MAGGGARASYQVGVLQAIAEILPKGVRQPFPIITGTSAGAINALGLAGGPGNFRYRVQSLTSIWKSLSSESVYRSDLFGVAGNAAEILWDIIRSSRKRDRALALLDNAPLQELLQDVVQFTHIEQAIARGELEAIGVTAVNYSNGHSTTFYQGQAHIKPWSRAKRHSVPCTLKVEHLLASSALPTLFPATRIGNDFFGDGALRQTRPLSAAINLGADRLFIIGVSEKKHDQKPKNNVITPPTIPQVLGHMLSAVFLDSIDTDLETLQRLNALVEKLHTKKPDKTQKLNTTRPHKSGKEVKIIDTLVISPSHSLTSIAQEYVNELPRLMRWFLKRTGPIKKGGSDEALSYILFEQGYCQRLIELGYTDALARSDDIREFFDLSPESSEHHQNSHLKSKGPIIQKPINPIVRMCYQIIGKKIQRIQRSSPSP